MASEVKQLAALKPEAQQRARCATPSQQAPRLHPPGAAGGGAEVQSPAEGRLPRPGTRWSQGQHREGFSLHKDLKGFKEQL